MSEMHHAPKIDYPCQWEYKTIGPDEARMREAIAQIMEGLEHTVQSANVSRTGKYCSLLLLVEVVSESHRNDIFAALSNHESIRVVI